MAARQLSRAVLDTTFVSALSGVLGSLLGASATAATTWVAQKSISRREVVRDEMRKREALYAEFIRESAKLLVDAGTHTLENLETLLPAYALLNRIRLSASRPVLEEAENLLKRITDQYFATNMTVEEMRRIALKDGADPLNPFGEACRRELSSMRDTL
jgi:hypothetical protein